MNYNSFVLDSEMVSGFSGVSGVYFISDSNGHIKIGQSNDIPRRLQEIQTNSPTRCCLIQYIKLENQADRDDWENALHNYFKDYRLKGEWFDEKPIIDFLGEENLFTIDLVGRKLWPMARKRYAEAEKKAEVENDTEH